MGRLIAGTYVTLDGVMQAPGGPDEDRSGGFTHGGWSFHYWDDEMGRTITETTERADALLLGRKTYDIFAAHWPHAPEDDRVARKLNRVPKYVASNTAHRLEWNNSRLLRGGRLADEVGRLKAEHDEIAVIGSGDLLQSLIRLDLVDAFDVWVFPLVLGTGKRLFGNGAAPAGLELTGSRTFGTGVVLLSYRRAGEPRYGSFAMEA